MSKPLHTNPGHLIDNPMAFSRANFEMLKNVALDLTEAGHRHQALRIEGVRAAVGEHSKRCRFMLDTLSDTAALFEQWSTPTQARMQKFTEIANDWIEVGSNTFTGMGEAMEQTFSMPGELMNKLGQWERPVAFDRRLSASVITFPERRAAGVETAHAESTQPLAKRRHAA